MFRDIKPHNYIKFPLMDSDGDEQNKILKREGKKIKYFKRCNINVSSIFQSIRVRCNSIFTNIMDRKFMESELRFVLYYGVIFWILFILYQIIK